MPVSKMQNGIWEIKVGGQSCWVTPDGRAHYDVVSAERRMRDLEYKEATRDRRVHKP